MLLFLGPGTDEKSRRDQLEKLYNTYRQPMLALAGSYLHDRYDAEDAVHSVFLNLAKRRIVIPEAVTSERDLRNYLLTAVRNTAINMLKEKRPLSLEENEALPDELKDPDFSDLICDRLEYEELLQIMKTLRPPYQEVLYCRFALEMEPAEIGRLLKESSGTVRKQLERGKKLLLREYLRRSGHDDER